MLKFWDQGSKFQTQLATIKISRSEAGDIRSLQLQIIYFVILLTFMVHFAQCKEIRKLAKFLGLLSAIKYIVIGKTSWIPKSRPKLGSGIYPSKVEHNGKTRK